MVEGHQSDVMRHDSIRSNGDGSDDLVPGDGVGVLVVRGRMANVAFMIMKHKTLLQPFST